ncbi:uncharacterized protein [Haliotis asinina]|uniref:uncharacterized protein n=1 Tax=Haliotis asinina TaxID=109174 RepID=UPI003531EE04
MIDLPTFAIKVYILFIFADLSTLCDSTGVGKARWRYDGASNISCVLYAKRILTCNYDLPDSIQRDLTTCTTCSQSTKQQTPNGTCPNTHVVFGFACNTSVGKCVYDCDSLKFCDYYHMIKFILTGSDGKEPVSTCRQIRTERYIQPGPVRNLTVTTINSTTLRVEWKKPDDRYRYFDEYRYIVRYRDEKKHSLKTEDEDVAVVLTDLVPWGNYNITVWARRNIGGFRSIPQTVSTQVDELRPAAHSDAKWEEEMTSVAPLTVGLTVIFAVISTALIAVFTVFVKKRMTCARIAITLPKMMPFPLIEESGTSFVQVSRGCRNEADFAGFTAKRGDLCEDGPWLVRFPGTDVSLDCGMQQQNCRKTSFDGGMKSGSCLHGNEVESDATSGDEPELIETWSYSTDSDLSAYCYKQVTLGSGCPWTVSNP